MSVFNVGQLGLREMDTDPSNAKDGDMFYASAAHATRDEGIYVYENGAWIDATTVNTDSQTAAQVPFTPDGDIAATDTQAAIVEVRDDTDTKLAGKASSSHTHTLSDVTDSGTAAALNVPAAGDAAVGEVVKGDDTRLTDSRTPSSHSIAGAEHSADTLANLNSKVSDATLIDTGDSRLSDDRTASGLRSATTTVSVSAATAPTTGQVLTATSGTAATWQAAGGSDNLGNHTATQNLDLNNNDITNLDSTDWNNALTKPAHQEGRSFYDQDEHTIAIYNDATDITHQLGQEFLIRVYNNSGATITDGKAVYVSGTEATEDRPTIALARADALSTSKVIGISTHSIANNTYGYITYGGLVNDIDTSSFSSGDHLFLSTTTAGGFQTTAPTEPGASEVHLGYVIKSNATTGRILAAVAGNMEIKTDANFGTEYQYAESLTNSATTSTTYVQKLRMTTLSIPAGDYEVSWSGEQLTDKATTAVAFKVEVDDTTVVGENNREFADSAYYYGFSGFAKVTLTAGVHDIDVDHKTDSGAGTGSQIRNVRLKIVRVS